MSNGRITAEMGFKRKFVNPKTNSTSVSNAIRNVITRHVIPRLSKSLFI